MRLSSILVSLALLLAATAAYAGAPPPPPTPGNTPDPGRCSSSTPQFCLNQPTGSITDLDQLRAFMTTARGCAGGAGGGQMSSNCGATSAAGTSAGLRVPVKVAAASSAAGLLDADDSPWAVWANYGRSRTKGTLPAAPSTTDMNSYRLGADRSLGTRYVIGAAASIESGDTSTAYNGGGADREAYTIAPYLLVQLNDVFSVDVNGGVGTNRVSQRRIDPTNGATLVSSYQGLRWFTSATLNASKTYRDIVFGGRAGLFEAQENQRGYTESGGPNALTVGARTPRLGQALIGADVGYILFGRLEAYVGAVFRYDIHRSNGGNLSGVSSASLQSPDRTGLDWTLGLRFFTRRTFSGFVEYTKTEWRDGLDYRALNLLVRVEL